MILEKRKTVMITFQFGYYPWSECLHNEALRITQGDKTFHFKVY